MVSSSGCVVVYGMFYRVYYVDSFLNCFIQYWNCVEYGGTRTSLGKAIFIGSVAGRAAVDRLDLDLSKPLLSSYIYL